MRNTTFIIKVAALVAMMFLATDLSAQRSNESPARKHLRTLVERYENVPNVEAMICEEGVELTTVKLMLRPQFGRKFLKGVDMLAIIAFTEASPELVNEIKRETDKFSEMLTMIDVAEEAAEELEEGQEFKCFIGETGNDMVSDFLMWIADKETKCIFYFGGELDMDELEMELE